MVDINIFCLSTTHTRCLPLAFLCGFLLLFVGGDMQLLGVSYFCPYLLW